MKKILLLVLVLTLGLTCFCSCFKKNPDDKGDKGDETDLPENFIFGEGSTLNYVYSADVAANLFRRLKARYFSITLT